MEAVRLLAEAAGIALEEGDARENAEAAEARRMTELNERALHHFRHALKELPAGRKALDYLLARGITQESIDAFKLGYALPQWAALASQLIKEHYEAESLYTLGLARPDKDGKGAHDYFHDRVMFPIHDERGRLVAFGGRVIDEGEPKYLNSPESPVFKKRAVLYGLPFARKAIGKNDLAIIAEGYMDVIGLHQAGITYAIAPLGTALTRDHFKKIARLTRRLIFLFDGDAAGRKAAFAAARPAIELNFSVRVVLLDAKVDAFDLSRTLPRQELEEFVRRGIPLTDFILNCLYQESDSGEKALGFLDRVYAWLADMQEEVLVSLFLQKAALLCNANPEELEIDFRKKRKQGGHRPAQDAAKKNLPDSPPVTKFRLEKTGTDADFEIYLLRLVGLHPAAWPALQSEFAQGLRIENSEARFMLDALASLAESAPAWTEEAFQAAMPTEALQKLVAGDIAAGKFSVDWEKQLRDTLDTLWAQAVRRERRMLDEEMRRQKLTGDEDMLQELQNRILALRRREDALKHTARRQK
jgi:DNA primase